MKRSEAKVYAHPGQSKFLSKSQKFRTAVCGRMWGKSVCIGFSIYHKMKYLPGSKGVLTCQTKLQMKTQVLPSIKRVWASIGLVENFDYVCFKKPPEELEFKRPVGGWPDDYKDVIMFANGTVVVVVSARQYDSIRGGSYDWAEIDEAGFFPEDFFTKIIMWTIRGNRGIWPKTVTVGNRTIPTCQYQVSIYTSMPWRKDRQWPVKMEEKAMLDPDLFHYQEGTSYDNPAALEDGEIDKMKKSMGHLEFQVECMNMRINFAEKPFYHAFDSETHCTTKSIYNKSTDIDVSVDPGAHFTGMTCWQESNNLYQCINAFNQKLGSPRALAKDFCEYYEDHEYKVVNLFGDPRGNNPSEFGASYFEELQEALESYGWECNIMVDAYQTESHEDRYLEMNAALSGAVDNLPTISFLETHCKDVIIAMSITESTNDFKKDKSSERNRSFPQENAPHYTDTVDYIYFQKFGWIMGLDDGYRPHAVH